MSLMLFYSAELTAVQHLKMKRGDLIASMTDALITSASTQHICQASSADTGFIRLITGLLWAKTAVSHYLLLK